jgi:hypothetical protein
VPPAFYQAFSLQIFTNLKLFFPIANLSPNNQWQGATTGVMPPTRQKGATPVRVGGNDRQLPLYDLSLIPFCF